MSILTNADDNVVSLMDMAKDHSHAGVKGKAYQNKLAGILRRTTRTPAATCKKTATELESSSSSEEEDEEVKHVVTWVEAHRPKPTPAGAIVPGPEFFHPLKCINGGVHMSLAEMKISKAKKELAHCQQVCCVLPPLPVCRTDSDPGTPQPPHLSTRRSSATRTGRLVRPPRR